MTSRVEPLLRAREADRAMTPDAVALPVLFLEGV